MPSQQPIRSKAGNLFSGVALHGIWEGHLQSPPGFPVDLNRSDLLGSESVIGVEKRRVQVGPQCFSDEVSHMDVVPRRFSLLPFKRLLWIIAGLEQGSVPSFDHDTVGFENGTLVLARKVDGESLISGIRRHYYILEKVSLTLDIPDCARNRCCNLDRLKLVPSLETAMRC